MSNFHTADGTPGHAQYQVYADVQRARSLDLATNRPIHQIVADLLLEFQLPHQAEHADTAGPYALFAGPERRLLSREQTLAQTSYAHGGELYLARAYAPWWIATPVGEAPRSSVTRVVSARRFALSPMSMGVGIAAALVVVLGLLMLAWPAAQAEPAAAPSLASAADATATPVQPTATLLPATPTPDPVTKAAQAYQAGLTAYNSQDWAKAAEALQQVYAFNPNYLDVRQVLSATYYNWGVHLLSPSQATAALEKFSTTLTIMPEHQLALGQQQRVRLYIDGVNARQESDWKNSALKLEELVGLQADFLDASAMLYEVYLQYGAELEHLGQVRDALRVYTKAAALPVPDTSEAQRRATALQPTPTPVPTRAPGRLRFRLLNNDDNPSCVSVQVRGIATGGWSFSVDGMRLGGGFDGGGNARLCGLSAGQEVTITVFNEQGRVVAGGGGIPTRGGAIMVADWR